MNCENEGFLLGAMKYSLVPPILAVCDAIVWLIDSYLAGLPYTFVIWCGWIVQGFYMGGATVRNRYHSHLDSYDQMAKLLLQTLAARLNGDWRCKNTEDGGASARLCNEFFADVGLMWVAVLTTWFILFYLYKLSAYYPRGLSTDTTSYRA